MARAYAAVLLLLAPCATAAPTCTAAKGCSNGLALLQLQVRPNVYINHDWLIVNKKRYSRKRAHDAWLGRVGRTNGIWIRPVMINFRTTAPEEWLVENVQISTTLELTSSQYSRISTTGYIPAFGGSGDFSFHHNSSHNASYVLRGLTFQDTFRIKNWFNNRSNYAFMQHYKDMYDVVHKPRIVTTAWVLVKSDAREEALHCTGGHLTLKYSGANFSISGTGCGQYTWSFNPKTIIAYEASYLTMENMFTVPPRGRVKDVAVDWYWTR